METSLWGLWALRFMTWGEQSSGKRGLQRGGIRGQARPRVSEGSSLGLTDTNSFIFPGCPCPAHLILLGHCPEKPVLCLVPRDHRDQHQDREGLGLARESLPSLLLLGRKLALVA